MTERHCTSECSKRVRFTRFQIPFRRGCCKPATKPQPGQGRRLPVIPVLRSTSRRIPFVKSPASPPKTFTLGRPVTSLSRFKDWQLTQEISARWTHVCLWVRAEGLLPLFCTDRLVPRLILESEFWSLGGSCKFHSTRLCGSTGYVTCLKVTGLTSRISGAFPPGSRSPDLALLLCCVRRTDVMSPAPSKGDEVRDQLHACAPPIPKVH